MEAKDLEQRINNEIYKQNQANINQATTQQNKIPVLKKGVN